MGYSVAVSIVFHKYKQMCFHSNYTFTQINRSLWSQWVVGKTLDISVELNFDTFYVKITAEAYNIIKN